MYAIGSKASAEHPEQSGIISRNYVSASGIIEPDLKDNGAHDKLREADQKEHVAPCVAGTILQFHWFQGLRLVSVAVWNHIEE